MPDIVTITWEEIEVAVTSLARQITKIGQKYDGVCGIARGGVIPAVLIAGRLGIRKFRTFQVRFYNDDEKEPGKRGYAIADEPATYFPGKWLFVDDIIDSGETRKVVEDRFLGHHFCALFARKHMKGKVMAGLVLKEDSWLEFPWEKYRGASK